MSALNACMYVISYEMQILICTLHALWCLSKCFLIGNFCRELSSFRASSSGRQQAMAFGSAFR